MKQGLTYISNRTKQLRYASDTHTRSGSGIVQNDENEQWLQPISIYYAKVGGIKRGDPVSIATEFTNDQLTNDPYPYVEVTDASKHKKCIGIALEPAGKAGDAIHVQPFGKVVYDDTKDDSKEKKLSVDFGKSAKYKDLAGKVVYIGQTAGSFTVDFDQAYLNNHNIIQVGVITDAPNTNEHEYAIELQPEADGRGALDSTQFELKLGEAISFQPDELKVLALAGTKVLGNYTVAIAGNLEGRGFILFVPENGTTAYIYGDSTKATEEEKEYLKKFSLKTVTLNNGQISIADNKAYSYYISSGAKGYVSLKVLLMPQPAESGTLITAHAGYATRSNIIGVYHNGKVARTFAKGETLKIIKQGLITHEKENTYVKGKSYYLEDNGHLSTEPNFFYDRVSYVGVAISDKELIVNCGKPAYAHYGTKPVGYIKPLYDVNNPDYGFISMNNFIVTESNYPALYNFLIRAGINPKLNKPGYQIKYLDEGYEDLSLPRVPYINIVGDTLVYDNSNVTVKFNLKHDLAVEGKGFDVSSLAYWSPMGIEGSSGPDLSSFDIHLSVNLSTSSTDPDKWVEIYPGFYQYGSNTYGFNWALNTDASNKVILSIDTGDKGNYGIAYFGDPSKAPTLLNGHEYKLYISRRDNGYTSIDLTQSLLALTQDTYNKNSSLPISGKGVREALDTQSTLSSKKVLDSAYDIDTSKYDPSLVDHFNLENSDYKDLLKGDSKALMALHEINSIIYKYNEDHESAKPFIGVLIDQLKKIVDSSDFTGSHKIPATNNKGFDEYQLTSDQKESIQKIIKLLYNDKESAQVTSSSIGLLIKAASETQKRLLDIETAVFGRDYETIPDSQGQLNSSDYPSSDKVPVKPAKIGLVRIANALSKEVLGSSNPTGDAADPNQSSNGNRIKDLYQQIEGTNGDYGEVGIELNLLDGKNGATTIGNQKKSGAKSETEGNEIYPNKGFNTYPVIEYDNDRTNTDVNSMPYRPGNQKPVEPKEKADSVYPKFEGINDAINRIVYKLNKLTEEVHGYDDIKSRPARLDELRNRINGLNKFFIKIDTYTQDIFENNSETIEDEYTAVNTDLSKYKTLTDIYKNDLYTPWSKFDTITNRTNNDTASIIEIIKKTIGFPIINNKDIVLDHVNDLDEEDKKYLFTDINNNVVNERYTYPLTRRLTHLERAVDIVATELFKNDDEEFLDIGAHFENLSTWIKTKGDKSDKADITTVQTEWKNNSGFKTLNNLIFGDESPTDNNIKNNIINIIIKELTGADSYQKTGDYYRPQFTTESPYTYIDLFKDFLTNNGLVNQDIDTSDTLKNSKPLVSQDYIFEVESDDIKYVNGNTSDSVTANKYLSSRHIFYAKNKSNNIITTTGESFVKKYVLKPGQVYQFYKDEAGKFSLVNDYHDITLAEGETVTIHGTDDNAVATIQGKANGQLDITATNVTKLVIPTSSNSEKGALYIDK